MARVRIRKKHIHHRKRRVRKKHSQNRKLSYLIEFRIQGKAKSEIKLMIQEVNKKFRIRPNHRPVPHISIAGPIKTNDESRLINDVYGVCSKYPLMKFKVDGFGVFEDNRVVYIGIKPNDKFKEFRWEIIQKIKSYCKLPDHNYEKEWHPHTTLAMNIDPNKYIKIKSYINKKEKLNFEHIVIRISLIKKEFILREYDFLLRRYLNRKLAKSRRILRQTLSLLEKYFEGKYDPDKNLKRIIYHKPKSLWEKIKSLFGA